MGTVEGAAAAGWRWATCVCLMKTSTAGLVGGLGLCPGALREIEDVARTSLAGSAVATTGSHPCCAKAAVGASTARRAPAVSAHSAALARALLLPPRQLYVAGSLHHQVGLQRAGRLDRLQDGDDALRLQADPVEAADQRLQVGPADDGEVAALLADGDNACRE